MRAAVPIWVGVDVGGARKGFHAVAVGPGQLVGQRNTRDPEDLAAWCRSLQAGLIAIDAPSRWSGDGRMRPCERQLLREGIRCFASPSREQAIHHPSDYYGWMLRGEALYEALAASHPRCLGLPITGPACFETFPHAITWQLRGGQADAARKREQRSALLRSAGIALDTFSSLDWIDAALCALAAQRIAAGQPCRVYGEAVSGLILVPAAPAAAPGRARSRPRGG